jgi:hypothetical protein
MEHNTVAIEVRFWTDSRRSDFLATSSNVRLAMAGALRREGIEPANPALLSLDRPGQESLAAEVVDATSGK